MKIGRYRFLRVLLGFSLIVSGLALGLDLLRSRLLTDPKEILKDLINFTVFFGLYQQKSWAYYPGLALLSVGIIVTPLYYSEFNLLVQFILIGFNAILMWLLYSCRKLYRKLYKK